MTVVTGCVVVTWKCWKGSTGMMDWMSTGLLRWSFVLNSASSMYIIQIWCHSLGLCYLLMILLDCVVCDCHWMIMSYFRLWHYVEYGWVCFVVLLFSWPIIYQSFSSFSELYNRAYLRWFVTTRTYDSSLCEWLNNNNNGHCHENMSCLYDYWWLWLPNQWLECNGTQANAVPPTANLWFKAFLHHCYKYRKTHTTELTGGKT